MSLMDKAARSSLLNPLFAQWNQLSNRDRLALKGLSSFFGLFFIYTLAIKPILDFETEQQKYFESRVEFLTEIKGYEPDLKKIKGKGGANARASGSATSIINRLARSKSISIKQISPDRDNKVRATFENVNGLKLLELIEELSSKHNVTVSQASIDRRDVGKINAKLVFNG